MNVLLIGYGAIAQEVLKHIEPDEDANITGIVVRPGRVKEVRDVLLKRDIEVVSSFDELSTKPRFGGGVCRSCWRAGIWC